MKIKRLGGGITNRNYKLTFGNEAFVLRIGGNDTERLGIDRTVERAATENAARLGIGPEVVDFLEPEGFLVTRFLEGEVGRLTRAEGETLLARLHAGPPIPGRFDVFRVVEAYAEINEPPQFRWAQSIARRVESRLGARPLAACHNDLLPANFAVNNDFPVADDEPDEVVLMRFMSDFREAMWGAVQQRLSALDFDFVDHADRHFERLEATASDPRFTLALSSGA